jgi:hypothetical protein
MPAGWLRISANGLPGQFGLAQPNDGTLPIFRFDESGAAQEEADRSTDVRPRTDRRDGSVPAGPSTRVRLDLLRFRWTTKSL